MCKIGAITVAADYFFGRFLIPQVTRHRRKQLHTYTCIVDYAGSAEVSVLSEGYSATGRISARPARVCFWFKSQQSICVHHTIERAGPSGQEGERESERGAMNLMC